MRGLVDAPSATVEAPAAGWGRCAGPAGARTHALNGSDDPRVGAAPAEVRLQPRTDGRVVRVAIAGQQPDGGDDHARRAVPTLHRVRLDERLLHGVQVARLGDPFHRRHGAAGHCWELEHARVSGVAIHEHGACAAGALAAPVLRTRQAEILAQHGQQAALRITVEFVVDTVDHDPDGRRRHGIPRSWSARSIAGRTTRLTDPPAVVIQLGDPAGSRCCPTAPLPRPGSATLGGQRVVADTRWGASRRSLAGSGSQNRSGVRCGLEL